MRDSMAARGPDGSGLWASPDGRTALAHRRLAIIDLTEAGAQPMASADARLHITFNGEIYNYRELREALAAEGEVFRSHSDTEVLLALYARRGATMVHALRGMFAFAIWDEARKTLFLARDPFGIKPLYVADDGRTLRFASQVKALMAPGRLSREPDPAGHVGFFVLGSVPEPFTMYRSVRALASGTTLTLRRGAAPPIERYFDLAKETIEAGHARDVLAGRDRDEFLAQTLRDSVRSHLVADVPVGLFLSSGLDSSIVAALATRIHAASLHSVTLGFEEYRGTRNDETLLAARTAQHLGTEHRTRWITREAFEASFDRLLDAMDQPSIDGVNTYFVSMAARESGLKVALSGLGGDELFGGYPSFRDVPRIERTFRFLRHRPGLGRWTRRLAAPLLSAVVSPKYASLAEYGGSFAGAYLLRRALYMPWELGRFMDRAFFEEGWERLGLLERLRETTGEIANDRQRVAALELGWYLRNQLLRDADWAGMAHSLEIRVPLVDPEVFRAVAPLMLEANAPTKQEVAHTIRDLLPRTLLERGKTGFSIPVHEWAKGAHIARGPQRQLRNWAHIVQRPYKPLRALAFLPDAFGGHGGIALYNRDLLTSLCAMPDVAEVVAVPRLIGTRMEPLPAKLRYRIEAANSKLRYLATAASILLGDTRFDMVLCGHVNLLPVAVAAKLRVRAPLLMFIYGIDAWKPQPAHKRALIRQVDRFVSISDVTSAKFDAWSAVGRDRIALLPNAIHTDWYGPGGRNPRLVARYGLEGKVVLMTLGRLVSSERYKGFDEVLEALPALAKEIPNLVYLLVGDGTDRARLEHKAADLGVADRVRFTGLIPEAEKADHYRLADAYVMPSRGEGFGFVLLEAMACGVPTVASRLDGGREAVRDGMLGILIDPSDPEDVKRGIREALERGRGEPPAGLDFFSFDNFASRTRSLVQETARPNRLRRQAA